MTVRAGEHKTRIVGITTPRRRTRRRADRRREEAEFEDFLRGYASRGVLTVAFGSFSTKEIQAATIRPITVASRGVL